MRIILFWILAGTAQGVHECIHDTYVVPQLRSHHAFPFRVTQAEDESHGRRLQNANESVRADAAMRRLSAGGSALRIRVDYTYLDQGLYQCTDSWGNVKNVNREEGPFKCDPNDVVNNDMKKHIKELTEAAVKWFKRALRVLHPTRGPLSLKKYCYQFAPPPNKFEGGKTEYNPACYSTRTEGCAYSVPNTDFELVVTANPTQGSTLAYALTCQSDDVVGRPIAGLVNFGPARLREASPNLDNIDKSLATAIHEIAHAMGFSGSKFEDFIDSQGKPLGKDNVLRTFQSSQVGKEVTRIVTPKVVEQMKEQFACYDWPDAGGEIEDFGGSGTAGSHWEKRVFRDEFMTGTDSKNAVLSAISLAFFEDTGWYKADYSVAEHLHWGYKAGCNFVAHKCNTWDDRFFCDTAEEKGCGHQHRSKGYCNLANYGSPLPVQHRYIPSSHNTGGQDSHADYCPFYSAFSNGDCTAEDNAAEQSDTVWGETYGKDSRCIDTTLFSKDFVRPSFDAPRQSCLVTSCEDGLLTIYIGSTKEKKGKPVICPVNGGKIDATHSEFPGSVWCPAANTICVDTPDDKDQRLADQRSKIAKPKTVPELPTDMNCDKQQELKLTQVPDMNLAKDQSACLWINLQDSTVGKLSLQVTGIKGMIYMSSSSGTVQKNVDRSERTDEPKLEEWPKKGASEVARPLNTGGDPITFPQGLLESGTRLLITVVAEEKSVNGVLELSVACAQTCQNGGTCERGLCQCKQGWAGLRCTDKKCPNDCSDHGECDLVSGSCICAVGWTSGDCSDKEGVSDFESGRVAVGQWVYFRVKCPEASKGNAQLTYRMTKSSETPTADPFLYAQVGDSRPTSSKYVARDQNAWQSKRSEAKVTLSVRGCRWYSRKCEGGATIGIYNMREYALEELKYTGSVSCELRGDIQPCPSTSKGECNGQGECELDKGTNTNSCSCNKEWSGKVCDDQRFEPKQDTGSDEGKPKPQIVKDFTLKTGDVQYLTLTVEGFKGKQMDLHIGGLASSEWIGISVFHGIPPKKPSKDNARNCDYHNYDIKWKQDKIGIAEVVVPKITMPEYTVMFLNSGVKPVTFKLEATLWTPAAVETSKSWKRWPFGNNFLATNAFAPLAELAVLVDEDDTAATDDIGELDSPRVPLAAIGEDGRLPNPILSMSSRSSVEGMASSKDMQLLKVEEFCSQSRTGLYVKCSNIDGTATVCSDRPAVVFHGVHHNQQPKDVSDFLTRVVTQPGPPSKKWAHLPDWSDHCKNHVKVPLDSQNQFVGVAALQRGQFITFQAVMQGKSTNLFLNDSGQLKAGFGLVGTAVLASLITAFVMSFCVFGAWHKQKSANENAERANGNARQFTTNLRRSVAASKEKQHLTELADTSHVQHSADRSTTPNWGFNAPAAAHPHLIPHE